MSFIENPSLVLRKSDGLSLGAEALFSFSIAFFHRIDNEFAAKWKSGKNCHVFTEKFSDFDWKSVQKWYIIEKIISAQERRGMRG
ncbi:hypothetical protein H9X84_07715 [Anaerotignum lactatifermentans]|uniref:Uncharacterized protein n=1 Tax=Anaerotignum lactatifermentans TaxID=160404 RepID=A0ABS2G991_9FIRM|nr:hypothetical protein [Anaerotignum lactatifermentans]MBM6878004.1 hypothetical protein [Anaerotignum lactatifermentans]